MKYLPSLMLILSCFQLIAQKELILESGETIEFKKMKHFPTYVELKMEGKREKKEINIEKVVAYKALKSQTIFYKVPNMLNTLTLRAPVPYTFLERLVEGEINVYKDVVANTTYGQNGPMTTYTTYLYLQKGKEYYLTFMSGFMLFTRGEFKRKIEILIRDNPEVLEQFNNDFKLKYKEVLALATLYNSKF